MPNIQIINPITYQCWDDFIISNKSYSFFHSKNWAEVICKSYNYKPFYFLLSDESSKKALAPMIEIKSHLTGKRGVSLPFTDHCEPLFSEARYFTDLLKHIIKFGKKSGWKYIEIRGGKKLFKNVPPSSYFYTHTLDLDKNVEKLLSDFRSSTKRNIKKATREGVECEIFRSFESAKEFYRLNCKTRKEHGLPPQPFKFFKNIYNYVIAKSLGTVVLASYKKNVIAGAIYFQYKDTVIYKYGASDKIYQHLRGNNLVMWKAIKWYAQNGYKLIDMGITEPNNKGLIQFKNGWGAQKRKIAYYRYDLKKNDFVKKNSDIYSGIHSDIHSFYRKLFSKMPLPLLKIVSTLAYKHVG